MTLRLLSRFRAVRAPVTLSAVALSFVLGAATQHFREAHAQSAPAVASTVYVPNGGLIFRTLDGRPVARIGRDDAGGIVEIYDARGDVAQRLSARAASTAAAADVRRRAGAFPDDDPFNARPFEASTVAVDPGF